MTPEQKLQNEIRIAIAGRCILFRANVGKAWTGTVKEQSDDEITLTNPRRFSTGLPPGFSDLFGVTPDGRFLALEVKTPTGKVSEEQEKFIAAIKRSGGRAGIVRSVADALAVLEQR